jgi:hypothetical protein
MVIVNAGLTPADMLLEITSFILETLFPGQLLLAKLIKPCTSAGPMEVSPYLM